MIKASQFFRLIHINYVLMKHGLDEIVLATHLFRPIRFLVYLSPWHWLKRDKGSRGARIRLVLEELGPIFVKFGQIVSTRRDLLAPDIAEELAKLQDQVPPFPGDIARAIIEKELDASIDDIYDSFDETPLASASIAQVHAAHLKDGSDVIVKVVRPDIKKRIKRDIELLYTLAHLAQRYWKDGKRLRPVEVVEHYEKTIMGELNLSYEAANAAQLKRNFSDTELLYVPEVYWDYTRRNVMTMERIYGIQISDIQGLKDAGVDFKKLSEQGVEIFFTQVFRDSFFHADMHPGNVYVRPDGRYMAIDFGIMGTLSNKDKHYLASNFIAFFNRDYRRVAELHVESEWVPAGTPVEEFEAAIRTVCEPIFEKPIKDISFGRLLISLFQTARRFDMEVQPQLVLLQKTLLNIEGLGRELYDELDLWKTAKPFLEKWMSEQIGPRAFVNSLKKNAPWWIENLPDLPRTLQTALESTKHQAKYAKQQAEEIKQLKRDIHRGQQRTFIAISASAALIAAAIVYGLDGFEPVMIGEAPALTWLLGIFALYLFIVHWPNGKD
ncbi:MAG: ubiquinone biosynthesis regulatory protein kinase UbiB [Gammaproteobacteria bacterium]|nr:ubiquinone biosynthesis regulatory protein kinase UbiB [Gammaproteobacteria bacterium]